MHYTIQHVTQFDYGSPISDSLMEVRMQPRSEGAQRCLDFQLSLEPRARVLGYRDFLGNWVHYFNVPRRHQQLAVTARTRVTLDPVAALPEALDRGTWAELDRWAEADEHWDHRHPSRFAEWSDALVAYAGALGAPEARETDPLTMVRGVMAAIHRDFEYAPKTTRVDSPIDEALAARRGVCQDFAHIMLAVVRRLGVPARYVSGYIAPQSDIDRRGLIAVATHAWVEVLLPELGWIGLDPTNNAEAGVRHVRVAVGRDYADVPPTRGVFKGDASSTLSVSVEVRPEAPGRTGGAAFVESWVVETATPAASVEWDWRQVQQQQRQQ